MVADRHKINSTSLTARLLVLGDNQVGKTASIVRYTTGRFIQDYSKSTENWLYRQPLNFDSKQNLFTSIELLEQKDVQFSTTNDLTISANETNDISNQTLASRVAFDLKLENELQERQQLINKLNWATAYIVIYAINDMTTYEKAIRYLNLIANIINTPLETNNRKNSHRNSLLYNSNKKLNSSNLQTKNETKNCNNILSSKLLNRFSPSIIHNDFLSSNNNNINNNNNQYNSFNNGGSFVNYSSQSQNSLNSSSFIKKPILLIGNKQDLARDGRKVNTKDGRLLAIRHQSMFAEVSIADSNKSLECLIENFIGQIDLSLYHSEKVDSFTVPNILGKNQSIITIWDPIKETTSSNQMYATGPIKGRIIKSKPTISSIVQSTKISTFAKPENEVCLGLSKDFKINQKSQKKTTSVGAENREHLERKQRSTGTHPTRYEILKSSFKRASMAIVGTRTLAKNFKDSDKQNNNLKSRSIEEEQPPTSTFIKGNFKVLNSRETLRNSGEVTDAVSLNTARSNRIGSCASDSKADVRNEINKKPILKYTSRRKTVAFEQIKPSGGISPIVKQTMQSGFMNDWELSNQPTILVGTGANNWIYNDLSQRCSSSSLSTSDYVSPPLSATGHERARSSTGSMSISSCNFSDINGGGSSVTPTGLNSISTLSRGSTSGGSHDDSGDEVIWTGKLPFTDSAVVQTNQDPTNKIEMSNLHLNFRLFNKSQS